jgi:hydroxyacylglutathione hydrolase
MSLEIVTLVLGDLLNNTYVIADPQSGDAAVIDPAMDSQPVLDLVAQRGWQLRAVWLTHAHFDHIAGVRQVVDSQTPTLPVGLHPADLPLYRRGGGAADFGLAIPPAPEPAIHFEHGQVLTLGASTLEVRFSPGHTPGHVVIYAPDAGVAFCGDVIFRGSVGRTDLPGGSHRQLIGSIQTQILTLPRETRLFCGHGPETSVGEEIRDNPFL